MSESKSKTVNRFVNIVLKWTGGAAPFVFVCHTLCFSTTLQLIADAPESFKVRENKNSREIINAAAAALFALRLNGNAIRIELNSARFRSSSSKKEKITYQF